MATEDTARPTLTWTDLVAGAPVVALAVVAVSSLAWAHVHHHSLAAVALTTLLGLVGLVAVFRRLGGPVQVRADHRGVAAVLVCGALGAALFLPGFSYGVADKDPGGYVTHSMLIARTGSYSLTDPALAHPDLPVELYDEPGPRDVRFPGVWVRDRESGLVVPQFFHLWPALLATGHEAGGMRGIRVMTPLAGIAAVMALVGVLRRVGGVTAGVIGGVLLATNMLQVWQSKFPSSEMFAQALFVASLLAVVIAAQERWGPPAAVAGALTAVSFLNRAEGWLLVMLAAGVIAALLAARRAEREALWAGAGLAALLPYAAWNAYVAAEPYTHDNGVPSLAKTAALLTVLALATVALRTVVRRPVAAVMEWAGRATTQRRIGLAVCAAAGLLLVLGFLRSRLFGTAYLTQAGVRLRSLDEHNLRRLSWFLSVPAFALAWCGLAWVALRRWSTAAWVVALPALVLLPIYGYRARVSTRLMWWGRRYVSNVVPGLVLLLALALAVAVFWTWRGRRPLRVPALLTVALLAGYYLSQSLPLRSHDEFRGSFGVSEHLSALAGDQRGVFLWEQPPRCCSHPTMLWASPVWLARGELSVVMPKDPSAHAAYVAAYQQAFPDDPVFLVYNGTARPTVPGATALETMRGSMPMWLESTVERPDRPRAMRYEFTVYRVK